MRLRWGGYTGNSKQQQNIAWRKWERKLELPFCLLELSKHQRDPSGLTVAIILLPIPKQGQLFPQPASQT